MTEILQSNEKSPCHHESASVEKGFDNSLATFFPRPEVPSSSNRLDDIYRPIQYLGSKLRALGALKTQVSALLAPGSHILDLFTGSTVVAQALSMEGMRVTATDAMAYSATFGKALLGIGKPDEPGSPKDLANLVFSQAHTERLEQIFEYWLAREQLALRQHDSDMLFSLASELPQIWRPISEAYELKRLFDALACHENRSAVNIGGIISTHYAGTYFGLGQAITLDGLRLSIERLYQSQQISEWQYHSALTALLSALSTCAFTPGKHFAQYHRISKSKDLSFHRSRILADRNIDVRAEFHKALQQIYVHPQRKSHANSAYQITMESLMNSPNLIRNVDLIYADPPYTAQQYSRFYHIPEIFVTYQVPKLDLFRGGYTAGLYPESRFKSRFSSKTQAQDAFDDLLLLSKRMGAHLMISYSETESGNTGNQRMISLDGIVSVCKKYSSDVDLIRLPHRYRQFNSTLTSVNGRADSEYIILVNRPC